MKHILTSCLLVSVLLVGTVRPCMAYRDHRGLPDQGYVQGSGLRSIRDRVEAVGGQFALSTAPGQGTRVDIFLSHKPKNPHLGGTEF